MNKILLIDDEENVHYSFKRLFENEYLIISAQNSSSALKYLKMDRPDIILLDVRLGDENGIDLLKSIKKINKQIPVIIITAYSNFENTIIAMKNGAFDYHIKPFDIPKLRNIIQKAFDIKKQTHAKKISYTSQDDLLQSQDIIIGQCEAMQEVYKLIGRVAVEDVTVLIRGESGTGKELVARAIYRHSHRSRKPFIVVNSAALTETLLESELFGHEKGSFTGAYTHHIGSFERANNGTIFLDEIGDMPISTQTKILRFIQEGEFTRVGGNEVLKADVRLIAATHRNLEALVQTRAFREDLYYRLNVVSITLPPLRERLNDINDLTNYFIKKYGSKSSVRGCSAKTLKLLERQTWHGNVRELENTIKRSIVLCKGNILKDEDIQFLPLTIKDNEKNEAPTSMTVEDILQKMVNTGNLPLIPHLEKKTIEFALKKTRHNQVHASKLLGINRNTLRNRMHKYGLD